jgi:hypothetical protein
MSLIKITASDSQDKTLKLLMIKILESTKHYKPIFSPILIGKKLSKTNLIKFVKKLILQNKIIKNKIITYFQADLKRSKIHLNKKTIT